MHDFGVSLSLEMMIFMVSRVKISIWKNNRRNSSGLHS